jgi:hypothetical protein
MATAISLSNQRRDHQFGVLIFEMRGIYEKKNQKSGEARKRPEFRVQENQEVYSHLKSISVEPCLS